jgi:hypothetical protein
MKNLNQKYYIAEGATESFPAIRYLTTSGLDVGVAQKRILEDSQRK